MIFKSGKLGVLLEAVLVTVVGIAFAFATNCISPRGLALTRNYFPSGANGTVRPAAVPVPTTGASSTNPATVSIEQLLAAQIKREGMQLIDGREARQLFHESESDRSIVFIDARDEEHYQAGHIPGAHEFDPYYPEKYLPEVLPVCQAAEKIVVYCNGGDCDDSQNAALLLKGIGISTQKLLIYGGGITEWTNSSLPVETGMPRRSNATSTTR